MERKLKQNDWFSAPAVLRGSSVSHCQKNPFPHGIGFLADYHLRLWVPWADIRAAAGPAILPEPVVSTSADLDFDLESPIYTVNRSQIEAMEQGSNSPFDQILTHAPGVSQDSAGQVHFREEDPYYHYYLNGILLPRSING